jgi:hypothetical protein
LQAERPLWTLSSYGHRRDGGNDLLGDVSFEEARWKFYTVCLIRFDEASCRHYMVGVLD